MTVAGPDLVIDTSARVWTSVTTVLEVLSSSSSSSVVESAVAKFDSSVPSATLAGTSAVILILMVASAARVARVVEPVQASSASQSVAGAMKVQNSSPVSRPAARR